MTTKTLIHGNRNTGKTSAALTFATTHKSPYLSPNPHANITGLTSTVAHEIALPLEPTTTNPHALHHRITRIAQQLNITHLLNHHPLNLSGGQTQLVALAAALAPNPPALALDEPFNHLDPHTRSTVLKTLATYTGNLLWTSTRPSPQEQALATHTRHLATTETHPTPTITLPPRTPTTLTTSNLAISPHPRKTKNRTPILTNLNLTIHPGQTIIITAPNGTGKTALLRTLAGLTPPTHGTITLTNPHTTLINPHTHKPHQRIHHIRYTHQNPTHHHLTTTVHKELTLHPNNTPSTLQTLLHATNLTHHTTTHPHDLNPTQQQLLTLATALSTKAPILLLDEPTSHTDTPGLHQTINLITAHTQAGGTAIITSHDPHLTHNLPHTPLTL